MTNIINEKKLNILIKYSLMTIEHEINLDNKNIDNYILIIGEFLSSIYKINPKFISTRNKNLIIIEINKFTGLLNNKYNIDDKIFFLNPLNDDFRKIKVFKILNLLTDLSQNLL